MRAKKITAAAFFVVLFGCSWVLPASAEVNPVWVPPIRLSAPGERAKQPQIATVDAETVAVWLQFDGSDWIVQESSRPRGGSFSAPIDLSAPGANASDLRLVLNGRGAAVVVWRSTDGTDHVIQASIRRGEREGFGLGNPGEYSFSRSVDLSEAGESAGEPKVAINNRGEAIAVWERSNGSNDVVQMSALNPETETWSSPATLSTSGQNAAEPDVGIRYSGTAAVVWRRFNGSNQVGQAVTRNGRGSFSEPQDLSAGGTDVSNPEVALAEFGAIAVWESSESNGDSIEESTWSEGGSEFTEPTELGAAGSATSLQIDREGHRVVWSEHGILNTRAQSNFGEFPGPTQTTHLVGEVDQLNLSGSPDVVWGSGNDSEAAIEGLEFPVSEPFRISSAGRADGEPAIAGYEWSRDLAAIWVHSEAEGSVIQVSGLDAEGPVFPQEVYGPGEQVGIPHRFGTLEAFDLWSEVVGIEWDFGDGSFATGGAAEHAFCAGTYPVRYTVTNANGQSNSHESSLVVEGSNAPKIGTFFEELDADGTGSLKVAVPCHGEVDMEGPGLQPWSDRLEKAETVSIPLVATGSAREEIDETGEATVEPRISFEPQGASLERASTSVTLLGRLEPRPLRPFWTRCMTAPGSDRHDLLVHGVLCETAQRALANLARKPRNTGRGPVRSDGFLCQFRPGAPRKVKCHRGRRWILGNPSDLQRRSPSRDD